MSDEKIRKLKSVNSDLRSFSSFVKAKELGISFAPSDLNIDQLNKFSIIKTKLSELEERGNGGQLKNPIQSSK